MEFFQQSRDPEIWVVQRFDKKKQQWLSLPPVSLKSLKEQLQRSELRDQDFCWKPGWKAWKKVSNLNFESYQVPQTFIESKKQNNNFSKWMLSALIITGFAFGAVRVSNLEIVKKNTNYNNPYFLKVSAMRSVNKPYEFTVRWPEKDFNLSVWQEEARGPGGKGKLEGAYRIEQIQEGVFKVDLSSFDFKPGVYHLLVSSKQNLDLELSREFVVNAPL